MSNSLANLRGAVAKTSDEPRKKTVRDIIMERQADIAKALPAAAGMTPERLTMVAYTLVHSNPKLGNCTPQSLIGALMTAAQLGLEPGPQQHVYFIPRWNSRLKNDEATFMIGYKGMVELARRNGVQIKTRTVYQGDVFEIEYGFEDRVVHKPALDEDKQGEVRGYYLTATWEGGSYVAWMNMRDIERIRERSLAKDSGPWKTDYDAMARKTLVRAAFNSNQIPQSLAISQAINADESVRTSVEASALDIPREPDATEDRAVPTSVGSPALPAPRDDEADGDDRGEADEGRQDAGDAPLEDRGDGDSDRVGGEADLSPPDEMPDDIEAALMWLRSLTPKELREQAKRYRSVVPKNAADVDAMTELAQRIIDTRTAS